MEIDRKRAGLEDNPRLLSPPSLDPLYQCATAVVVRGFVPHADIDVDVDGTVTALPDVGVPTLDGVTLTLPAPLVAGQTVRVRQRRSPGRSKFSDPVTVRDHTAEFPAGLPRPALDAPVFECGAAVGVSNLLAGSTASVTANGPVVGQSLGGPDHRTIATAPDFTPGQVVTAVAGLCADASLPAIAQVAQPHPVTLPAPFVEPFFEGTALIIVGGLVNGARFDIARGGTAIGSFVTGTSRSSIALDPPAGPAEVFTVSQRMCPGQPSSPPGTGTAQPCSSMPAPNVAPIQDGADRVLLTAFVPGAIVKVFRNGSLIGAGSGPVVMLTAKVQHGDRIDVLQDLAGCTGKTVQRVTAVCFAPSIATSPADLSIYAVGQKDFDGGTVNILGRQLHVRGSVFYPAQRDGTDAPFHERLGGLGPVPVVFLVHGNHSPADPSFRGYDYFQAQLAARGMVAVSVDHNELNGFGGGPNNIESRARLLTATIQFFQGLSSGGDPTFGGKLDMARVGLMGHSRGGEAVIRAAESPLPAGVRILSVLSLAPVDFGVASNRAANYLFMTLLPAADGDVVDNDGAKFYDRAPPSPAKVQLYAHHANHNFFNRRWLNDDARGGLPLMTRLAHERILSAYGTALFRHTLLGQDHADFLTGRIIPAGVENQNVQLSFALDRSKTIDDFEQPGGIATNTLGGANTTSGGLTANEFPFRQVGGAFNRSFFEDTMGAVLVVPKRDGRLRLALVKPTDFRDRAVVVRAAEVFTGAIPAGATGFQVGLEDAEGQTAFVDVDDVGGLPRPFDRTGFDALTKSMPRTFRFPSGCFTAVQPKLLIRQIRAVILRLNRNDQRPLAFDDIQILS